VLDDTHLLIPDVAGNRLFQSFANLVENPQVGLLFLIPGDDDSARVNGRVEIVDKEKLAALNIQMEIFNPDEHAKIWQGLLLTVDEAYSHCPRALKFAKFWDVETIARNGAPA
ncbi:MAG: pyridoxamine 5'-phosphate oxidase family protein, partial [Chloroflexota bacterium]|nr:pyridoxamine 5'-phosphate oxidase family protein [Chloroflexota bacterium]